jgi:PAS domain S-box-containing protein
VARRGSFSLEAGRDWPRLTQLLDILAEAVTIRDRDGSIAYANRAALRSMGFRSIAELQSRPSQEVMDDYVVEDENGNPLSIDDVPSMRLMHGEDAPALLMRTVHKVTGELSWRQLKTTPLYDDEGEIVAAVTVIEDLTAVKTAEVRTRALADSGRLLASSLEYEQTLQNVANIAVPALADWCAVDLVGEALQRETRVVAHPDPARLALAERLRAFEPDAIAPDSVEGRVLRTGNSELFPQITDEQLVQGARDPEQLELMRQLEMRSALVVPLRVPARTIGLMTLVTAESRRTLTQDDVELAEQLGRRAAVAVENARLHTTLMGVSETLQQSLRPDDLPDVPGWDVSCLYQPAGSEQRIQVGGDFYEVFSSGEAWIAMIGDVTGKGVAAATLTALLRHGARFAARHDATPAGILRQLDEALRSRSAPSLCTALCARLEESQIVFSSAGHPPPLLVPRAGPVREVPNNGPLLGAFEEAQWPEATIVLDVDQLVLLYTDGVIETVGRRDRFGSQRLKAVLEANATASPDDLLSALNVELDKFRAGPRRDDVAALALRAKRG